MSALGTRLRSALVIMVCIGTFAACGEQGPFSPGSGPGLTSGGFVRKTPTPSPIPTPTRSPLPAIATPGSMTPPPGSIYFGAFVQTTGIVGGDSPTQVAALEQQLGRKLALDNHYIAFGQDLSVKRLRDDFQNFRVPVISLQCQTTNAAIARGDFDASIIQMGRELSFYKWPVMMRLDYDVNLPAGIVQGGGCYDPQTDLPAGIFNPAKFIAAWEHIYNLWTLPPPTGLGLTNVVWVWSVSGEQVSGRQLDPRQYYPGAAYVNWISIDSYDLVQGGQPIGFNATYQTLYNELAPLGLPIMVGETGAAINQPSFFENATTDLPSNFPQIKAFVYYDAINYNTGMSADFRVQPNAMSAFTAFADTPYMGAFYGH